MPAATRQFIGSFFPTQYKIRNRSFLKTLEKMPSLVAITCLMPQAAWQCAAQML